MKIIKGRDILKVKIVSTWLIYITKIENNRISFDYTVIDEDGWKEGNYPMDSPCEAFDILDHNPELIQRNATKKDWERYKITYKVF